MGDMPSGSGAMPAGAGSIVMAVDLASASFGIVTDAAPDVTVPPIGPTSVVTGAMIDVPPEEDDDAPVEADDDPAALQPERRTNEAARTTWER